MEAASAPGCEFVSSSLSWPLGDPTMHDQAPEGSARFHFANGRQAVSPLPLHSRDIVALNRTAGMPFMVSAVDWSMDDAPPQTHIGDVMVLFPVI